MKTVYLLILVLLSAAPALADKSVSVNTNEVVGNPAFWRSNLVAGTNILLTFDPWNRPIIHALATNAEAGASASAWEALSTNALTAKLDSSLYAAAWGALSTNALVDTNHLAAYARQTNTALGGWLLVPGNLTNLGQSVYLDPGNAGYAMAFYAQDRAFVLRDGRLGFNAWFYGSGDHGLNSNLTVSGRVGIGAAPEAEQLRVNGSALIETNAEVRGALKARAAFLTNLVQVAKSLAYDGTNVLTDATAGNQFRLTLTQNSMLLSPANSQDGQRVTWELVQDATGIRTMTFGSAFKFGSDVPVAVLTTNGGKRDFLTAVCNGTNWYVVGFIRGF